MKVFTDIKVIIALIVVAIVFFFVGSQYRLYQIRQAFIKSFAEFSTGLGSGSNTQVFSGTNLSQ